MQNNIVQLPIPETMSYNPDDLYDICTYEDDAFDESQISDKPITDETVTFRINERYR